MRSWLLIAAMASISAISSGTAQAQGPKEFAGIASHYGKGYKGKTASGQMYDPSKLTAAHRTLPFGTRLLVTDKKTKRSVTVIVNDRGPFIKGRVVDLSDAAAAQLQMQKRGLIQVTAAVE